MPDVTLDDLKNAADQLDQLRHTAQERTQAEGSAKEMLDTAQTDYTDAAQATADARAEVSASVDSYIKMIRDFAGLDPTARAAQPRQPNAVARPRR